MRLINTTTYEFMEFFDDEIPQYTILSHRWGKDEVSYKEFRKRQVPQGAGYRKIIEFCRFSKSRGYDWAWVDTCCIDKRSSAELSEAINSMFNWYRRAVLCVVYLFDVSDETSTVWSMQYSEWFKRGWTLQELLAPKNIIFTMSNWRVIGHLCKRNGFSLQCKTMGPKYGAHLNDHISKITGIEAKFLNRSSSKFSDASVAKIMSWASQRKLSRIEDTAYCLLGLFDVNLPLLYGEGERAFLRLQEEIMKRKDDDSIFAWNFLAASQRSPGFLAPEPAFFADSGLIDHQFGSYIQQSYALTNKGLEFLGPSQRLELPAGTRHEGKVPVYFVIKLNCAERRKHSEPRLDPVELILLELGPNFYERVPSDRICCGCGNRVKDYSRVTVGEKLFVIRAHEIDWSSILSLL